MGGLGQNLFSEKGGWAGSIENLELLINKALLTKWKWRLLEDNNANWKGLSYIDMVSSLLFFYMVQWLWLIMVA